MTILKNKNSHKLHYFSFGICRKVFLISENNLHKTKEKVIRDRASVIPLTFIGIKTCIYNGHRFQKKKSTAEWLVLSLVSLLEIVRLHCLKRNNLKKKKK